MDLIRFIRPIPPPDVFPYFPTVPPEEVDKVLSEGFQDWVWPNRYHDGTDDLGVFLWTPGCADPGDVVFEISIPEDELWLYDVAFNAERPGCLVYFVPAEIVNRYGPPRVLTVPQWPVP